jgi:putative inorganic carbon (hco3(-)) transporter
MTTKLFQLPDLSSRSTYLLVGLAAVGVGTAIGLATSYLPLLLYLGVAGVLACVFGFLMLRYTHWTVGAFFLAFALQTTLFAGFEVRGLYYPLYLLMLANGIMGLIAGRVKVSVGIVINYLLFFTVVILSLFNIATPLDFEVFQRLFIYILGFFVFFQFSSEQAFQTLIRVQVCAGFIVAGWVILDAAQGGFAGRGISEVDQNNVTSTIALGLIPLFALQLFSKAGLWLRAVGWLALAGGIYATLLLASRGISLALAVAFMVMFARLLNNPRRSIPLIIVAIAGAIVIASLPGSDNLAQRFTQGDVATANGRVPLWTAAISEINTSPALQLLFGHGYNYTLLVTNRVVGFLYSVHNTYLQMALDFGLLGVGLFLLLHATVIRLLWRFNDSLSLYGIGTVVFLLFSNLTLQAADGFLYWVVLGTALAVAVWRRQTTQVSSPTNTHTLVKRSLVK